MAERFEIPKRALLPYNFCAAPSLATSTCTLRIGIRKKQSQARGRQVYMEDSIITRSAAWIPKLPKIQGTKKDYRVNSMVSKS
jgi:hypothetical protein